MDRQIITRQISTLADDLTSIAGAMARELKEEQRIIDDNARITEENKKKAGDLPLAALQGTVRSPVGYYRSRLVFLTFRLNATLDYMKDKQIW